MDVHAIGNQAKDRPAAQNGADQAGLTVVQRRHRVEQVGGHARASRKRSLCGVCVRA